MAEKCTNVNDRDNPPAKKVKLNDEDAIENTDTSENDAAREIELNLSNFKVTKVLQNNCVRKSICIEGTFEDREGSAIVLLEQKTFPHDKLILEKGFFDGKTLFRKHFTNDIYRNYDCFPTEEYNSTFLFTTDFSCITVLVIYSFTNKCIFSVSQGIHTTVIYPATQNHIEKYKRQELYIIDETYELYQQVTLPYIESKSLSLEVYIEFI